MTAGGSVVVRRQLGIKLRKLRLGAGKTFADVAVTGVASRAKLDRIEAGRVPVKLADIWALCRLYGADDATTDQLAQMAPGTQADDWWEQYGDAVAPEWFGLYAGLEAAASRIRSFEPELVPGLLQTAEYAALVIGADDPRVSFEAVTRGVQFRMQRQQAVRETEPRPMMTFVVGETALRFGPPDALEPQVDRLRALSSDPNVDVRVLPFSTRTYPRRGKFTLLDFDADDDPSLVYVEVPKGARYFDRPADLEEYEYVFDLISRKSIPINEWRRE
jgi:transcriptional regulator with XRE-family HTH domain